MDLFAAGLDVRPLEAIARRAGEAIMVYYRTEAGVRKKADDSPVTLADLAANALILRELAERYPGVPVISEEAENAPYAERERAPLVFVVDPLDGTKEFLAATGEFTVNIALVSGGSPVFGVLYAPALGRLYMGGPLTGSYRIDSAGHLERIAARPPKAGEPPVVLLSRCHPDPGIEAMLSSYAPFSSLVMGASLKFAALAEGAAHLYPRTYALHEWDTAAGDAILTGAGGIVTGRDGSPLPYNTPELKAGPFLARSWR